ncbi:MAG: vanadium-dependent haloperoxidase, partial [Bacteroidota bacterium]
VINEHIDPEWRPLLQTPPFPEYTSGHSVISTAAALTLTDWFGDNYAFDDSTEVEFDLPVRSYESFVAASQEAAVSRLYGGIHYRPAIDEGVAQGERVGRYVIENLEFKDGQAEESSEAEAAEQASIQ